MNCHGPKHRPSRRNWVVEALKWEAREKRRIVHDADAT
jgi:hypothetical protein